MSNIKHISEQQQSLKVEVITVENNSLQRTVCSNFKEFQEKFNENDFAGPFRSKIDGELALRFESKEACEILSN